MPVVKGPSLYQCAMHVVWEIQRTKQARDVLTKGQYKEFGRLMNDSHSSLKYVQITTNYYYNNYLFL